MSLQNIIIEHSTRILLIRTIRRFYFGPLVCQITVIGNEMNVKHQDLQIFVFKLKQYE